MRRYPLLCLLATTMTIGSAFAQSPDEQPPPKFRTVPWAILAGAGTDFDSYSLTVAARRGGFGLGFGYRRDTKLKIPAYATTAPPASATEETSYSLTKIGVDFYAAYPIAEGITGYGTIGGYTNINTLLVRDTDGSFYRSENSPDWSGAEVEYGAGLELKPLEWLITGIGYHSARGFNVHLGYAW